MEQYLDLDFLKETQRAPRVSYAWRGMYSELFASFLCVVISSGGGKQPLASPDIRCWLGTRPGRTELPQYLNTFITTYNITGWRALGPKALGAMSQILHPCGWLVRDSGDEILY